MTYGEFIAQVNNKANNGNRPTMEQYVEFIEPVYTFHPAISETEGKEQVAYLYAQFGLGIFEAMAWQAADARRREDNMNENKSKRAELQRQIDLLNEEIAMDEAVSKEVAASWIMPHKFGKL